MPLVKKLALPTFLTAFTLLLASCASVPQREFNADWPNGQFDAARTGSVVDAPRPPLQLKWSFATEGRIIAPPAVKDGVVYLGSRDSKIYALNLADGTKRWDIQLEQGGIQGAPALTDTTMFAGKAEAYYYVYSWDRVAGTDGWSRQTGELIGRPPWVLPDETRLYTHLDPEVNAPENVQTRMAALNQSNGETIWATPIGGVPEVPPALSETLLLTASSDEKLYAFDRETGAIKWQAELTGKPASSPLVHRGRVYVSTISGALYSFELDSGKVAWRHQFPDVSLQGNLALSGQLLLVPGLKGLYTFDTDKLEPRWTFRSPQEVTAPVASRNFVYLGCANNMLYVLRIENGSAAGVYRTGGEILASPVLAGGFVLVGSSDGKLYAYEEQPPREAPRQPQQKPPPSWMQRR